MKDVYEECPIYKKELVTLRHTTMEDAEELLKCYSDEKAVPFFNADNCHGDDFHYTTIERMRQAIDFWNFSYNNRYFVRWTVIFNSTGEKVGTIEMFHRVEEDEFNHYGVLRIDLQSNFEKKPFIDEILEIADENFFKAFDVKSILTKAAPDDTERIFSLLNNGYKPINRKFMIYDDYYEMNKESTSMDIVLRNLKFNDLKDYLYWNHPSREFHKYNGPYYKKDTEEELKKRVEEYKSQLLQGEENVFKNKKIIANRDTDEIIGLVSWYWKSQETLWLEVGIVIFNEHYWGRGIGYKALKMWINEIFDQNPKLVRIGLTTWSGNERMMKLAEKLGLKKEAVYRKARIVNNKYYDSVSFGILKEEWGK